MQSGSSSRSGCNRARAAVEADAIGEQQSNRTRSGAADDHESSEQQLKRAQSGSSNWMRRQTGSKQWKQMPQLGPGAAAEADAIGEKQLFRELSSAGLRTVGEQGGSS